MTKIKIKTTSEELRLHKGSLEAACYDLRAAKATALAPGSTSLIKTGVFLELPSGWEAQIRPRSGMALKHGLTVLNSPGTVDSDYTGEVGVIMHNTSDRVYNIEYAERIAQIAFRKVTPHDLEYIDELRKITQRGSGGFGSTGSIDTTSPSDISNSEWSAIYSELSTFEKKISIDPSLSPADRNRIIISDIQPLKACYIAGDRSISLYHQMAEAVTK
jgi:dUTP pyrophosphatase